MSPKWVKYHIFFAFFLLAAAAVEAAVCDPCCDDPGGCWGYSINSCGGTSGKNWIYPFEMDCNNCCHTCTRVRKFVWPVGGLDYAAERLDSTCDTGKDNKPLDPCFYGHLGLDLLAKDGDDVFAAFDGNVTRFNESGTDPDWYYLGCGLKLMSTDGEKVAYYGHLLEKDMAPDGLSVRAGDKIGRAGGDQENDFCRGSSEGGPRLYFELRERDPLTGAFTRYVDPKTCTADSSSYWYVDASSDDCVPNLDNTGDCKIQVFNKSETEGYTDYTYQAPSYSCGWNETTKEWVYAGITVNEEGDLNLSCTGTGANKTCYSEVYRLFNLSGEDPEPVIANQSDGDEDMSSLNCFLRFLRVWNDGTLECGKIVGQGSSTHIQYEGTDLNSYVDCYDDIVDIGTAQPDESRDVGYLSLQQVQSGESQNLFFSDIVISSEYTVIGVDDRNFTKMLEPSQIDSYSDIYENPVIEPYYIDYILVRSVDIGGMDEISQYCKTGSLGAVKDSPWVSQDDYHTMVRTAGFIPCKYSVIDGGKFFDDPALYISKFRVSRLAANRGVLYSSQI